MDAFSIYTLSTSAWHLLQALPLLVSPRLVVALLSSQVRDSTDLEAYLARVFAVSLLALSLLSLVLSGLVPLGNDAEEPQASTPYRTPTLLLTLVHHIAQMLFAYVRWSSGDGQFAFLIGALGSAAMALLGGWVALFGGDGSKEHHSSFLMPTPETRARKAEKRRARKMM